MQRNQSDSAVVFQDIRKTFGSVVANDSISFSVDQASITALLGENGAGKSTAMKILFGLYQQDSGKLVVDGKEVHWHSPVDAIAAGIGMVHQHFMLVETMTALDNIIIGAERGVLKIPRFPSVFNWIDHKKAIQKITVLMNRYGLHVPLLKKVSQLSVGLQQRIEILKLLYRNAHILILDEPTAVLTPPEVDVLFENLQKLKAEGKTILVVTHKLREALQFSDDLVIFRAGKMVHAMRTKGATEHQIARYMVGRSVDLHPAIPTPKNVETEVLRLDKVTMRHKKSLENQKHILSDICLSVRKGEIVGIAGVEGNGQSELLDIIFHPQKYFGTRGGRNLHRQATGKLHLLSKNVTHKSSAEMVDLSVGLIPEDRHQQGLLLDMDVRENYILGRHLEKKFRYCFGLFHNKLRIFRTASQAMEEYDVRPRRLRLPIGRFSGGNQQKLIIAREMGKHSDLLVAANPTRGVDIGAIEFIHKQIVAARDQGVGVLLVSAELEEVMTLSDRILVLYGGRIVASFARGEADDHVIGLAMCGGHVE